MGNNEIITYLDGTVGVTHFKKYHKFCKFLLSPYDDHTQRRADVKWELAVPSEVQFRDANFTWEEVKYSWEEFQKSDKLEEIFAIIGKAPLERRDGLHLDSAFKSGVHVFLTADKDNILNHRHELESLLGFRIFDPYREKDLLIDFIVNWIQSNTK